MLTQFKSYQCTAMITFISNKANNQYKVIQFSKITGEYRLEVLEPENLKDTVTICDGQKIIQMHKKIKGKIVVVKQNNIRSLILFNSFIKNYLQGEESAINVSNMNNNSVTVLEAVVPGNDKRVAFQKLWIDNKTLKPLQMVIYDNEGKKSIIIRYEEFFYNIELNDELFKIE